MLFESCGQIHDQGIRHLVVFGDSLSDNGFEGGHGFQRYSNGKVWAEYLAQKMALKSYEVRAWGGAMSGMGNYRSTAKEWSGLLWQIQRYTPATDMDATLVVVEIGTNDLHDPENMVTPAQVANNVMQGLEQLSAKGVKQILLWNMNTKLVFPGYTDKEYQWFDHYKNQHGASKKLRQEFNQLIVEVVKRFKDDHQWMRVDLFDLDSALIEISKKFENITTPWINCEHYPHKGGWFWFDHWHFMTETHDYLSDDIFKFISERFKSL